MKHGSKQGDNLGQRFWQERVHTMFIGPIPKSRVWFTVNCVVNATEGSMLKFYLFRGERMKEDYIRHYKSKTCMTMQSKGWMMSFFFKEFLSFLKRSIPKDIFQSKLHLVVLDGHGSHVTLEAIRQT